jgi:SAM-dependent methyltransferase
MDLRAAYARGENITRLLKEESGSDVNSIEAIELAYDLQTGSYIAALDNPDFAAYLDAYSDEFARRTADLDVGNSILDVGTGEGTTFSALMTKSGWRDKALGAFDLSWSRAHFARQYFAREGMGVRLFVANIAEIPLATDSVDTIVSSHALEPNGGREKELLTELHRICRRYMILLEPSNELGSKATKVRTREHGYIQNLRQHAEDLGMDVQNHTLMDNVINPANQTGLLIIRKSDGYSEDPFAFTAPGSDSPLREAAVEEGGFYYSPEEGLVFPQVAGIPCLRRDHAIPATKYGVNAFAS